jgi:hypothetical protein
MTTPTVPPTSEPVERTIPPETRPEPPLPDDCLPDENPFYPGLTRWTATPCDPATGRLLPLVEDDCLPDENPFYPGLTRFTATPCDPATGELLSTPVVQPVAAVAASTEPQDLPVTGVSSTEVSGLAAVMIVAGILVARFARRPTTR